MPTLVQRPLKGFTLVELLVVISIIAILSVIGVTVFSGVQKSARDARRRGDIEAIAKAFEIAKSTTGNYPIGCNDKWSSSVGWDASGCGLTGYIQDMPKDPVNIDTGTCNITDSCHLYHICTDGMVFAIVAGLEDGSDMGQASATCQVGSSHLFWIKNQQ